MMKRSAGVLIYRFATHGHPEVLLVHPGGPFWARKDEGAWSLPKGGIEPNEDDLAAARREVAEEIGTSLDGPFTLLGEIRQPGGKVVVAFAANADIDADAIVSNSFEMQWPPKSGLMQSFPEVDRAAWFDMDQAEVKLLRGQRPFLEAFKLLMERADTTSPRA
ncbi:NUDIX domain-containing protein [Rhizobium tumorigenes]|uniref:NUDIX domain-containing protein n=1 Tax=Rhizobium tumorigenes TaxID=2041385 RepID=A0AAF1K7D6_9HYPH|nr:NUDIX domain-containing protein [Rhizobium tumorigenes]WFR97175.1 NUDIX domain-containing protein [Rhizobium tumorigenes]